MSDPLAHRAPELVGASPLVHARVAGLVGVVVLASGSFAGVAASRLVVRGDAVATARSILASPSLFRPGIIGSLVMMIAFIFYALLLYALLAPVGKKQAVTMAALALASIAETTCSSGGGSSIGGGGSGGRSGTVRRPRHRL